MRNERDKKAKVLCALVAGIADKLFPVAYADEGGNGDNGGTPPADPPANGGSQTPANGGDNGGIKTPQINYEDLIKRARQEEKNKLYPEINKLKDELKTMTKHNNDNLLRIGQLEAENETLRNGNGESAVVKELRDKVATLEAENNQLKETTPPDEEALRTQIRTELEAEFNVKLYRTEKLASDEVKNSVLPMFYDNIGGNTNEEIDASIQKAIEMTNQAREQFGISAPTNPFGGSQTPANGGSPMNPQSPQQKQNPVNPQNPAGAGVFNVNPQNPLFSMGGQTQNIDYLSRLDPNSEEYKKFRQQMGLR